MLFRSLAALLLKGTAAPAARVASNLTPAGRALNAAGALSKPPPNQTPAGSKAEAASNRRAFKAGKRVRSAGGLTSRKEIARDRVVSIRRSRERNEEPPF